MKRSETAFFLRRVYLDIVSRVPTIEEAEAFHSESCENKRERLIEKLLPKPASPAMPPELVRFERNIRQRKSR